MHFKEQERKSLTVDEKPLFAPVKTIVFRLNQQCLSPPSLKQSTSVRRMNSWIVVDQKGKFLN